MSDTYVYHPMILTPYVLVFIVAWLLLRLLAELQIGLVPLSRDIFWILRVVVLIVALVLVLI